MFKFKVLEQNLKKLGQSVSAAVKGNISINQINPDKIIQFLQNIKPNDFSTQIFDEMTKSIKLLQGDPLMSGISFWSDLIKRFEDLCLDKDEQLQLLEFMFNFLKNNMDKQNLLNQNLFMKQMGQRFNEFEKRIFLKHKMCLLYFKYVKSNQDDLNLFNSKRLKFEMSLQEIKMVAQKAREFCQVNMEAFSFLSLYLIHSINTLHQRGQSFSEIHNLLDKNLKELQKIYPATKVQIQKQKQVINLDEISYCQTPQIIKLKQSDKTNYQQVEEYIITKAKKAIEDEEAFVELVKSVCLQKGYAFKSGVKIKDPLDHTAIQRTFQKLLSTQKFQPTLIDYKTKSINNPSTLPKDPKLNSKQNENAKLKDYVDTQKHVILQKIKQILKNQTQLQFNIKDLLRAKCMFNTTQDIKETLQKLLSKIKESNLTVYEIKDRLNKKTRDVTVIINLPNTRTQLQLALKFDKVSNQFNHKIYQLMRSIKFTIITNIQIHNQKWAQSFFNSQIYLFYRMLKAKNQKDFGQKVTFKDLKNDVEEFIKTYLENDFLGVNLIMKQEPNAQKIVQKSFNQLNQILFRNMKVKK